MKNLLIGLLGGYTKDELNTISIVQKKDIEVLQEKNKSLEKTKLQLDKLFLAMTDSLHNYNDQNNIEFSIKVREAARALRTYSIYSEPYRAIGDELFEKLFNIITSGLYGAFHDHNFPDGTYLEIKRLVDSINDSFGPSVGECYFNMQNLEDIKNQVINQ